MASAHHTRAPGARSVPKSPPAAAAAASPSSVSRRRAAARPKPKPERQRDPQHPEALRRQLAQMVLRLEILYATCVTVRLALKAQGAEQEEEMARCLMWQVAEPLSVQTQVLQAIVQGLQRRSTVGQPVRA
jgi:hypothetical protein